MSTSLLLDVPDDVFNVIAVRLSARSFARLMACCRALRRRLFVPRIIESRLAMRFGKDALPCMLQVDSDSAMSLLLHYSVLHQRAAVLPPNEMSIIWMNGTYWSMDKDDKAPFGAVARLHMVCWFDVRAQFVGVAQGFYRPVVTCSLTENIPHWQGELSFSMRAIVHSGGDVPSMSVKESRRLFNSVTARYPEWGDLSLDPVHVGSCRRGGSKYARVIVEMIDHSHRWKRGFAIAAVRLEPVDEDAKEFSAPIPKSLRLCK